MGTYSFLDTQASIVGPGGSVNLAEGAGAAEEGITIEPIDDMDTMTVGADGTPMHSLHANKAGLVTVRLLKTSPVNKKLMQMATFQRASSASHGQNTFSLSNTHLQDAVAARQCAFKRIPNLTYAKEGGMIEWTFNAGYVDPSLGDGA